MVGGGHDLLQRGQAAEQLAVGGVSADGAAQHHRRRRVGVDHPPLPVKGYHAVGHVEKQGVQLVALIFHLTQGVPQLPGHVVEGVGEHTDLIPRGHLDPPGEIPLRHPHGPFGQPLDGDDHGLGQQEGEQNRDEQAKNQRFQDQHKDLVDQVVHRGLIVQDVNDILDIPPAEGQRHIHVVRGDIGLVPLLLLHQGPGQVWGVVLQPPALRLVGPGQIGAGLPVQDVQGSAPAVQAQLAGIGLHDLQHGFRPVLLPGVLRLEGPAQSRVLALVKHLAHLGVKLLQIERHH